MLCDRVVGTWREEADRTLAEARRLDWLDLSWEQCHRRAIQATTRKGKPIRVLLRLGTLLRHLDIIADTPQRLIVVNIKPIETLVVRPQSLQQAAAVAMEWGNLHLPVEINGGEIITPADGPAQGVVERYGVDAIVQRRRFHPIRISGMSWKTALAAKPADPLLELQA